MNPVTATLIIASQLLIPLPLQLLSKSSRFCCRLLSLPRERYQIFVGWLQKMCSSELLLQSPFIVLALMAPLQFLAVPKWNFSWSNYTALRQILSLLAFKTTLMSKLATILWVLSLNWIIHILLRYTITPSATQRKTRFHQTYLSQELAKSALANY